MQETGKATARQDHGKQDKTKRDMANPEGTKAIVIGHQPADDDESALLGFESKNR
ncbi:hypothetical protein CGLO_10450 [Colletotrichum gloeosporioides Cg-14]|uniref:Uncharacterized protein n=1 Tax=Colletotrichum gloeosporioides (strain Cg-14) TaxID=1237896 RepID=T0LPM0_COLGC|nr:hypothetical protein CGLO_10450 [Colletotrichum gloeosporioides Cg-14]